MRDCSPEMFYIKALQVLNLHYNGIYVFAAEQSKDGWLSVYMLKFQHVKC